MQQFRLVGLTIRHETRQDDTLTAWDIHATMTTEPIN